MKQKELNEILEKHIMWLSMTEGGKRADLRGADLQGADLQDADLRGAYLRGAYLRGANIDYSSWPLWCGTNEVKIDRKIFLQLLAHICAVDVDDDECEKVQADLIPLAKQSHVAEWLF